MRPLKSFESIWLALTSVYEDCSVSDKSKEHYLCKSEKAYLQFNCIILPKLGKTVYASLESGTLIPIPEFKYRNGIPEFLKEIFSRVYTSDGQLRTNLSPAQIRCIHLLLELTMVFYKYEDASLVDNTADLVTKFRELQSSRKFFLNENNSLKRDTLIDKAKALIYRVLSNEDPTDIRPFHGSGAVATGERNWEKWTFHPFYPSLEKLYPESEYNRASYSHLCDDQAINLSWPEKRTIQVRIISVPKNSSTRRMIAVEEAYPQYIKLGLMQKMYDIIEHHPLTSGKVNFTQQEINRDLAKAASIDRSFATLDLSAASDSVYVGIVERLFPRAWRDALLSTRAEYATYKGDTFELSTFATMGSACCFPVEALVFWAIVSACVGHTQNFVYGDDIIVNNDSYNAVVDALSSLGFVVNEGKSYAKGFFRESCGGDYLHGYDVSTVKLRHNPRGSDDSTIQFLNNLSAVFGERAMLHVYDTIVSMTNDYIPFTTDKGYKSCAVLVLTERASNDVFLRRRYNNALQRFEYRLKTSVPALKKVEDSWFEVLRSLLGKSNSSYDR